MKKYRVFLLFYLLVSIKPGYSQIYDHEFKDAWIVTKTENIIGEMNQSNLSFNVISFLSNNKAEIYLKFITNGNESHLMDYYMNDSLLILKDYYTKDEFKIVEKSENQMILRQGDNNYYFKRLLKFKNNNLILVNDTIPNLLVGEDTIKVYKYQKPEYKGDLISLILKNQQHFIHYDTSYIIDLTFKLKVSGEIDDIKVNADTLSCNNAIKLILLTSKKWIICKEDNKKCDSKINIKILVESKSELNYKFRNIRRLSKYCFNEGLKYNSNAQLDSAMINFNDCEKLYDSFITLQSYSRDKNVDFLFDVKNIWISSILNQAVIYSQKGDKDNACEKLKKIALYDKEAYKNYKDFCTK